MNNGVFKFLVGILLLLAAATPRLVYLGTMLTVDEPLWVDRSAAFIRRIATLQFDKATPHLQPGVTTAWTAGLVSRFQSLAASQAAIAIATIVLIFLSGYFLAKLWPPFWAWSATFFLALDPFLIAHSRVVHTDALLSLFSLTSILSLLVFLEHIRQQHELTNVRYVIYSGVLAGFAILTKIFALAVVPFVSIAFFVYWIKTKLALSKFLYVISLWFLFAGATIFLFWPALLTNTITTIQNIYEGVSIYEEGTREGEATAQWWYYARVTAVRSTPITIALLPFSLYAFWKRREEKFVRTATWLFAAGLFYMIILSLRGERSDRYILFSLLTFVVTSVTGLRMILQFIQAEWNLTSKKIPYLAVGTLVLTLMLINATIFPYFLAFHNPAYPFQERQKLGWGEGLEQAAHWIENTDPSRTVATYYVRVFRHFYTGTGDVKPITKIPDNEPSFVVVYRAMFERAEGSPEAEVVHNYLDQREPVHTIYVNDLPYVWIFEQGG